MERNIIRIVILASSLWGIHALEITNLTVPNYVRNGTEESVLLDCVYVYEEEDKEKMVVKWFHNDDPFPVYQWIPELDSAKTTDKFGNRVSRNFELDTGDEFTKRRALHLLRPTIEMSGKYSCQVESMAGNAQDEGSMIIYATPSSVSINISSVEDTLYVTCIVEGVFPLPEIEIFHIEPGEMDSSLIEDVYESHVEDGDAFDAFLTTNVSAHELKSGDLHFFGCIVELEGTEYRKETRIPYYPKAHHLPNTGNRDDNVDDDDDNGDDGALDIRPSVTTILILASTLLVLRW